MSVLQIVRLNLADPAVGAMSHPTWAAEGDVAAIAATQRRLDAASAALRAAFPALIPGEADQAVVNEWMAGGMTRRAARARLDRLVVAQVGDGAAAHSVEVEIADHSALLTVAFHVHESAAHHEALRESLARAAGVVADATGFLAPKEGDAAAVSSDAPGAAAQVAAVADALCARALAALRRDKRRGWATFVALNAVALACVAAVIWGGETMKRRLTPTDPDRAYTFEVRGQAPVRRDRVPPAFPLVGTIRETGESTTLNVFRDTYVGARRGVEIIVLRGGQPDEPWLDPDRLAEFGPAFRLGPFAPAPLTLVGLVGGALWGVAIGWFYRRETPIGRAMLRALAGPWLKYAGVMLMLLAGVVYLNI